MKQNWQKRRNYGPEYAVSAERFSFCRFWDHNVDRTLARKWYKEMSLFPNKIIDISKQMDDGVIAHVIKTDVSVVKRSTLRRVQRTLILTRIEDVFCTWRGFCRGDCRTEMHWAFRKRATHLFQEQKASLAIRYRLCNKRIIGKSKSSCRDE